MPKTKEALMSWQKLKVLTKRLEIRPFDSGDYLAWRIGQEMRMPPVDRFDRGKPSLDKMSDTAFEKWLKTKKAAAKKDSHYVYGVFERKSAMVIGMLDIAPVSRGRLQVANLGYQIHNFCRGQGYAKEAVSSSLAPICEALELQRLEAGIEPENLASIAVARSIGMKEEGIREQYLFETGEGWIDLLYFSVHRGNLEIEPLELSSSDDLR